MKKLWYRLKDFVRFLIHGSMAPHHHRSQYIQKLTDQMAKTDTFYLKERGLTIIRSGGENITRDNRGEISKDPFGL